MNKPYHIHYFKKEGFKIHESYRVYDEVQELNVMLGTKKGKTYVIINIPENTNYKTEEFIGQSLSQDIRYLNKIGLTEVKQSLQSNSDKSLEFMKNLENTDFKNQLYICINNIRLKTIMLFASMFLMITFLFSFLI